MQPGEAVNGAGVPRCFSLMAGAGFDAKVVAGVSAPFKRRLGRAAYVWRSLVEARRYRPVRYGVEIDGVRHEASSVIVTRSRHYAGPYVVAPDAALGEPLLHVCLFERWGRSHTLRFGLALLLGRLPRTAGYRVVAGRDVRISVLSDAGEAGAPAGADRRRRRAHPAGVDRPRSARCALRVRGLRRLASRLRPRLRRDRACCSRCCTHDVRRGMAVGRQARLLLEQPHRRAGLGAQQAVGLVGVEAEPGQPRLHVDHGVARQRLVVGRRRPA